MYTIGKFARLGMVSSATLRFYDDIGLLKPCRIDGANGYRYYDEQQLSDVRFIGEMREYGFSLEEIKAFLPARDRAAVLLPAMEARLDALFREEQRTGYLRNRLKAKIDRMKGEPSMDGKNIVTERMEVKVITLDQPMKSAGIFLKIPEWPPNYEDLGALWGRFWGEDIGSQVPNRVFPTAQFGVLAMDNGAIYYMANERVTKYDDVPDAFMKFEVPVGKYAVCTFNAADFEQLTTKNLFLANDYLAKTWLPRSGYEFCGSFALEVYDDRSRRGESPEMDIWMMVKEKV